jgi:hypothetical protein
VYIQGEREFRFIVCIYTTSLYGGTARRSQRDKGNYQSPEERGLAKLKNARSKDAAAATVNHLCNCYCCCCCCGDAPTGCMRRRAHTQTQAAANYPSDTTRIVIPVVVVVPRENTPHVDVVVVGGQATASCCGT